MFTSTNYIGNTANNTWIIIVIIFFVIYIVVLLDINKDINKWIIDKALDVAADVANTNIDRAIAAKNSVVNTKDNVVALKQRIDQDGFAQVSSGIPPQYLYYITL